MSLNTVFNNIRSREKPNDVFITPRELAKLHIDMLDSWYHSPTRTWMDPCRNDGSSKMRVTRSRGCTYAVKLLPVELVFARDETRSAGTFSAAHSADH